MRYFIISVLAPLILFPLSSAAQSSLNYLFEEQSNEECHKLYNILYRNGRCTSCREAQFKYMLRDGYKDAHILNEAKYDVSEDIRKLVSLDG